MTKSSVFVISFALLMPLVNCCGQKIDPVVGYRQLLEQRFEGKQNDTIHSINRVNRLIDVVVSSSKKFDLIIPIELVTEQLDTVIASTAPKNCASFK